nr:uncharacterized protein LOC117224531 [Megalopta genalis]
MSKTAGIVFVALCLAASAHGQGSLLTMSQELWSKLLSGGFSKAGKLDPLRVPVIKVDQSEGDTSYRIILRNVEITGLNGSTVESIHIAKGRLKSNLSELEAGYVSYSDLRDLDAIRYRFHTLIKEPKLQNESFEAIVSATNQESRFKAATREQESRFERLRQYDPFLMKIQADRMREHVDQEEENASRESNYGGFSMEGARVVSRPEVARMIIGQKYPSDVQTVYALNAQADPRAQNYRAKENDGERPGYQEGGRVGSESGTTAYQESGRLGSESGTTGYQESSRFKPGSSPSGYQESGRFRSESGTTGYQENSQFKQRPSPSGYQESSQFRPGSSPSGYQESGRLRSESGTTGYQESSRFIPGSNPSIYRENSRFRSESGTTGYQESSQFRPESSSSGYQESSQFRPESSSSGYQESGRFGDRKDEGGYKDVQSQRRAGYEARGEGGRYEDVRSQGREAYGGRRVGDRYEDGQTAASENFESKVKGPGEPVYQGRIEKQPGYIDIVYADGQNDGSMKRFGNRRIESKENARVYGVKEIPKDVLEKKKMLAYNCTDGEPLTKRNDAVKAALEAKTLKNLDRYAKNYQEKQGFFEEGMQLVYHYGGMGNDTVDGKGAPGSRQKRASKDNETDDDVMHVILKIRAPNLRIKSDYELTGKVGKELVRGNGRLNGNFTELVGDFTIELKKTKDQGALMVRAARSKLRAKDQRVDFQGMDEKGPVKSILSHGLMAAEAVAAMLADDLATKALNDKSADAMIYRMYKNLPVRS